MTSIVYHTGLPGEEASGQNADSDASPNDSVFVLLLKPPKSWRSVRVTNQDLHALSVVFPNLASACMRIDLSAYVTNHVPQFSNLISLTLEFSTMHAITAALPPALTVLCGAPRLKTLHITHTEHTPGFESAVPLQKGIIDMLPFSLTEYGVTDFFASWLAPLQRSRTTLRRLSLSRTLIPQSALGREGPLLDRLAEQGPFPELHDLVLHVLPIFSGKELERLQRLMVQCSRLQRLEILLLRPEDVHRLLRTLDALFAPLMHLDLHLLRFPFISQSWMIDDDDIDDICAALLSTPVLHRLKSLTLHVPATLLQRTVVACNRLQHFCTTGRIKFQVSL